MQIEENMVPFIFNKRARISKVFMILGLSFFCECTLAQEVKSSNVLTETQRENRLAKLREEERAFRDLQALQVKIQEPDSIGRIEIRYINFHSLIYLSLEDIEGIEPSLSITSRANFDSFRQAWLNTKVSRGLLADVMWGVTLFDRKDQPIAAIFADKYARHGYINSVRVNFGPKEPGKWLLWWLYDNFYRIFEPDDRKGHRSSLECPRKYFDIDKETYKELFTNGNKETAVVLCRQWD
jgi:hypothetical protein